MLGAGDAIADAGQRQAEPHADVAEDVEDAPSSRTAMASSMPERRDDQDVEGNGDVGRDGAEGGDEHAARDHKRKRPPDAFAPAGVWID